MPHILFFIQNQLNWHFEKKFKDSNKHKSWRDYTRALDKSFTVFPVHPICLWLSYMTPHIDN